MELVYITHHSLLHAHYLAPALSWALVIGAVYGLVRMFRDLLGAINRRTTQTGHSG